MWPLRVWRHKVSQIQQHRFVSIVERYVARRVRKPECKYVTIDVILPRHGKCCSDANAAGNVKQRCTCNSVVLQERPNWRSHVAQFLMYVRSHFLRMPLHLLIPHLIRKQFAPAETR